MNKCLIFLFLLILSGCQSSQPKESPSAAHHASYVADHFSFEKKQPQREPQSWQFYYKHCSSEGSGAHFPRYACTEPH